MNKPVMRILGLVMVAGSLLLSTTALAQTKTLKDGVYTEAQAKAGEMVYDANCRTCHDMKFYENTLRAWNSQPLIYLWETIMGTMPQDNPGSLMFDEYTEVLAYILSGNDFPAGDVPLNHDEGMDQINIVPP